MDCHILSLIELLLKYLDYSFNIAESAYFFLFSFEGYVTMEQMFDFIEEPPLATSKEVFLNLDSIDQDGRIEFGDFMRTFATYCFFGKDEILK